MNEPPFYRFGLSFFWGLLLLLLGHSQASSEAALSDSGRKAILDELQALIDEGHFPGAAILLIHEDEIILREALGVVDVKTRAPFTVDQLCWWASTGKMFTATLAAMLVDDGVLSFDEPIANSFPEFSRIRLQDGSPVEQPVRIRHVMSHTSGVPGNQWLKQHGPSEEDPHHAGFYFPSNPQEFIDGCLKLGLVAQPGTRMLYGRPIDLVACVVEKKTGRTFPGLMASRVLEPLGMKSATLRPTEEDLKRLAPLYSSTQPHVFEPDDFGLRVAHRQNTGLSSAGGAVYATMDELGVLMQLHLHRGVHQGRRLVRAETLARLYEPQPATQGRYGLAFQIMKTGIGGESVLYNHPGYSGPLAWFDFERKLSGVLLMQSNTTGRGKLHQRVLDRIHAAIPVEP